MNPDLSVVIVSWNVRDLLRECLESIQRSPVTIHGSPQAEGINDVVVEVVVVDNESSDGTPDMVRETFPWVRLVEPGRNTGFSGGNNLGIEASTGRLVLFLNPDTCVLGDALPVMVAYLDEHPEIGVVGPQLLNADGTVQSSRRQFPSLWQAFFDSTWLKQVVPSKEWKRYYMCDGRDHEAGPVDWVIGAAFAVRREVIDQVGGFDERLFMYFEETDWQIRIKRAGWQIAYYPEAKIIHYGGKSSDQIVAQRHIRFQTSKVVFNRKYHGPFIAALVRLVLYAEYLRQIVTEAAKWLLGHKRDLRRARIIAYVQVLRSGFKG